MIIKNFELKKIEKNNANLVLLYGENEGFKQKIINDFFTKSFDGTVVVAAFFDATCISIPK